MKVSIAVRIKNLIWGNVSATGSIRLRRVRITSVAQIINRFITTGVGILSIPLAIAILGREEYGVWLTMVSLITWFAMSDLGLPSALVNPLAAALSERDSTQARRLISTTTILLTGLGLIVASVCVALVLLLPVERILGMSNTGFNSEVRWAFVLIIVFNIGALPLRLSTVISLAMQKGYWAAVIDTVAEIIVLAGLVILRLTGGTLVGFALATGVPMLIGRLVLWLFMSRRFGSNLIPRTRDFTRQILRTLGFNGITFFIGSLGELLVLQTPNIVIAQILGVAAVPVFAIPYQFYYSAYVILNTISSPLWPAYAEANTNGDRAWIRRTHWRITKESMALAIGGFLILTVFIGWFIGIWAGSEYVPSFSLLAIFCLHFLQWTWNFVFVTLLTGLGYIRERSAIVVIFGILDVILSVILTRYLGVIGIAAGMFLAMLLTQTWFLASLTFKKAHWIFERGLPDVPGPSKITEAL